MLKPNWQRIALEIRKHRPLEKASRDLGWHKDKLNQIARGDQKRLAFDEGLVFLDMAYDLMGAERLREVAT